ncbi:hypothetical protein [Cryobacterium mannosilyticum]|uniref:Uncharacterized protein n=1 Tax=Cryobacterium mannosilyticum TaxID=1259190 RepID=A0A4R8W8S8_9MICO|nr:hypothetical protein [Cryobacterium mannosilyticum]TFC04602.1 hypothetical protein E3O32_07760 [Cryobacterium mannosilyticum]
MATPSRIPASPAKRKGGSQPPSIPSPRLFYVAGGLLGAAAAAVFIWLYLVGLSGSLMVELLPFLGKDFNYPSLPGVILLFTGVALFFGEMFRRGRLSQRRRTFLQGGSVGLEMSPTPLRYALLWMLLPVVVYLLIIPLAVHAETSGSAWGATVRGASEDFWTLLSLYGFLAAGCVGVFLASLLKRATYRRLAARGTIPTGGARTFWRLTATQWRLETWFSFISLGLFGVLPLLWHDALAGQKPFDDAALADLTGIAAACAVLAVITVLNAWRSGDPYGFAESVA